VSTTRRAALGVALLACALIAGSCTDEPGFDRGAAVERVVDTAEPPVTDEQAGCYVDRVVDELGESALDPTAPLQDEQVRRRTVIRIDCLGASSLGSPVQSDRPAVTAALDEPFTYGQDEVLDSLWDACAAGDAAACDRLFLEAPLGSDYETFGATCGNRTAEPSCTERYPSPG
jgi:hypothetical protein